MKLPIIGEIKKLICWVREDDTSGFDYFENDIFVLFDPNEPVDCGCDEDDDLIEDGGGSDPPTEDNENPIMDELRNDAIQEQEEEWIDEDDDDGDFIRSVTIGVTGGIFASFDSPPIQSGFQMPIPMIGDTHDPDCVLAQPNFYHKPTNLKIWWLDQMTANQPIKFKSFANIVRQCIASLGRRTEEFMVRGLTYDGEYLDLDRMPIEEEPEDESDGEENANM